MKMVVDIILIVFLVLGTIAGMKRGLIKSAVNFIGLVAVIILGFALKTPLANFLIDKLPFFRFGGALEGLTSLNILIYNAVAFIVVFTLLYCVLNIVLAVTGFIDTLLKFTVIWIIPSKIGGAILGFLEAWLFIFLAVFVLSQFSFTNVLVSDSKVTDVVLNHTPVVGNYLSGVSKASQEIYEKIDKNNGDNKALNLAILQIEINYGLISKEKAQELMDTGKMGIDNVMFGKENSLWLNI